MSTTSSAAYLSEFVVLGVNPNDVGSMFVKNSTTVLYHNPNSPSIPLDISPPQLRRHLVCSYKQKSSDIGDTAETYRSHLSMIKDLHSSEDDFPDEIDS